MRKSLVVQLQAHLLEGKRSPVRAKTRLTKSAVGEIILSRTRPNIGLACVQDEEHFDALGCDGSDWRPGLGRLDLLTDQVAE